MFLIADMNGRTINSNTLKVSIARRQSMNSSNSSTSPVATSNETARPVGWVDIAEKYSQKGNYVDKRQAIEYEEDLFSS